jgi:hypothetical protein
VPWSLDIRAYNNSASGCVVELKSRLATRTIASGTGRSSTNGLLPLTKCGLSQSRKPKDQSVVNFSHPGLLNVYYLAWNGSVSFLVPFVCPVEPKDFRLVIDFSMEKARIIPELTKPGPDDCPIPLTLGHERIPVPSDQVRIQD